MQKCLNLNCGWKRIYQAAARQKEDQLQNEGERGADGSTGYTRYAWLTFCSSNIQRKCFRCKWKHAWKEGRKKELKKWVQVGKRERAAAEQKLCVNQSQWTLKNVFIFVKIFKTGCMLWSLGAQRENWQKESQKKKILILWNALTLYLEPIMNLQRIRQGHLDFNNLLLCVLHWHAKTRVFRVYMRVSTVTVKDT